MVTEQDNDPHQERMVILGNLDATSFEPWIRRHAAKLGLSQAVSRLSSNRVEIVLSGPEELRDMMEIGCSLGPIDVWVERIERWPVNRGNT